MIKQIPLWPAVIGLCFAFGYGAYAEVRGDGTKADGQCPAMTADRPLLADAGSSGSPQKPAVREVPNWVYEAVWYKGRLFRNARSAHRWRHENRERNGGDR